MPASACARARRCARPPSIRSRAGASSARATRVFVRDSSRQQREADARRSPSAPAGPASVVIVGGGAAGFAAAEMLRREGYDRTITMLSADDDPPCDRPNLSKDYLAGTAKDEWIPLKSPKFYEKRAIDLRLNARVTAIDPRNRRVTLADGKALDYGALLLATGADPVRLDLPGADVGRRALSAHARRQPGDHRRGGDGNARTRRSARASSGSRWRPRCARASSTSMSSRPRRGRWSASWGRISATSSAGCTRSKASSSISARP